MNKLITAFAIICLTATSVQAATTTERECWTDSYGNTTCRDKITNIETGVITYSNETVTVSSGTIANTSVTTSSNGTTSSQMQILNTALPSSASFLAAGSVVLGAVAMVLKQALHRWR